MTSPDRPLAPPAAGGARDWMFWAPVAAGLVLLVLGMIDTVNLAIDDVFISFRYAEHFATGHGLVFNPGERVEGFSNPLWTLMLAGFARAGWNRAAGDTSLLEAAKLAGALFGLAAFAITTWIAARRRRDEAFGTLAPLLGLAPLALGASYSFGLWSISGMETPMCACALVAALALQLEALRRHDASGAVAGALLLGAGALFGVACWTRPEPVFVWALTTVVFLGFAPVALRGAVVRGALVTLACWGALAAWRVGYFHAWLPNTVVAKTDLGPHGLILGAKYTLAGVFATVGGLMLGLLGLPVLLRGRSEWRYLALFVASYLLFGVCSGGDWFPGYRLLAPAFPAMVLLAVAATLAFVRRVTPPLPAPAVAAAVAVLAVVSFASERNLVRAQQAFPSGFGRVAWHASPLRFEVARRLASDVRPGRVVALAECGVIPYMNPGLRFMDVVGLMDPGFARHPADDVAYFIERNPDFYLVMIRWGQASREFVSLLAAPEFRQRYEQVAAFDGLAGRLATLERGIQPPAEEEQSFLLYRRRRPAGGTH